MSPGWGACGPQAPSPSSADYEEETKETFGKLLGVRRPLSRWVETNGNRVSDDYNRLSKPVAKIGRSEHVMQRMQPFISLSAVVACESLRNITVLWQLRNRRVLLLYY